MEEVTRIETMVNTRLKKSEIVLLREVQRQTGLSRNQLLKRAVREFLDRQTEANSAA